MNDITRRNALGGLAAGAAGAALLGRRGELGASAVPARPLAASAGVRNWPYWLHLDSSPISQATINTEAPRRSWIAFNAWEGGYIPAFRAAGASNPNLELYVYKDFSSTRSGDPGPKGETSGALLYSWVSSNHPGWFLTRSGQRIAWQGYSHTYAMNIGNPAYQQACRDAIVSDLEKNGWNGVFLDNILYSINQYAVAPCDQYSSDSAFQAAYKSAIGVICSGITAAGFKIIGNMSGIRTRPGLWDAYINAGMAGGFDEWFLCFGDGQELADYGSPPEGFIAQVNEVKYLMYGAKPHLPGGFQAHSLTNTQSFRYAFAGWLLGVSTPAFFSEAPSSYGPPPQWRREYNWDFGSFTGPYTTLQPSVYQRIFTNGMALVNANSSGSNVTVNLANAYGTVYLDQDGVSHTFVKLAPRTGMALRKVR